MNVAGLFAGIGGIELGLQLAGHETALLCEIDPGARRVLRVHFPETRLVGNVRDISSLPGNVALVAAGFPCQDLSQAGRTAGIRGKQSGLVGEIFRLLDARARRPPWLLLENVSFMLHLDRGRAMHYLVDELEARQYTWAYRVVDSRAFGLPQRRRRVILLASRTEDPRDVLFVDDRRPREPAFAPNLWCGFYWTEGLRGLGWAVDAIPPLKGGSTIGIPSPPGIWDPKAGLAFTPEIRDAERLQGFEADWTLPALDDPRVRKGQRWKLVGNAVSVPVARWLGECLANPREFDRTRQGSRLPRGVAWPRAAWGRRGCVYPVDVSMWPKRRTRPHLSRFLRYPTTPLSLGASSGFLSRAEVSRLSFEPGFLDAIRKHINHMGKAVA